jgi:hypothetical protein
VATPAFRFCARRLTATGLDGEAAAMTGAATPLDSLFQLTAQPWFFLATTVWVVAWVAGTAMYRAGRGKLFPRTPPDAVFSESWTSGRSERNFLTSLGGARNCLRVVLTPERLAIDAEFPFNLVPVELLYDNVQDIPVSAIGRVSERDGLLGRTVVVDFDRLDGRPSRYSLRLRSPDAFISAVKKVARRT